MLNVLEASIKRSTGQGLDQNKGDPFDVIPLKNMKCARETTEVHLGRRGIEILVNFNKLKNLEVLWLNDNNLTKIKGLDSNFRIKELYIHNNRIKSLEGSIRKMQHLQVLTAYNNQLSNLDKVIEFLADFTYLERLDIFENPLSEEPYYQRKMIAGLKNLNLFDRHAVKELDKVRAIRFVKSLSRFSLKEKKEKILLKPYEKNSACEKLLITNAKRILKQKAKKEKKERDLAMGIR